MTHITNQNLKDLFEYNSETGIITNKIRRSQRAKEGIESGSLRKDGYRYIFFSKTGLLSHRLAWYLHYGYFPTNQIDHIDGNKSNNKINNLRDATNKENHRNKSIQRNNISGKSGVSWKKSSNKWQVNISKHIYLGLYDNLELAIFVRECAEEKYGYHENHGRVA